MATTEERVIAILHERLGTAGFPIETRNSFYYDLGMDLMDIAGIVMALEESFNISIDERAPDLFTTVGNLIQYIDRLVAEQS
jgi:acyl carrier protein